MSDSFELDLTAIQAKHDRDRTLNHPRPRGLGWRHMVTGRIAEGVKRLRDALRLIDAGGAPADVSGRVAPQFSAPRATTQSCWARSPRRASVRW